MHISFFKPALLTAALAFSFAAAHAQNIAIVNGKAVPKSRVQALAAQLERSGRAVTPEMEELFADFQKNNPVTDAEVKAEYDKFASMNGGKEYKSRHILVEKEDQAKAIIASLKKGGKFEDIAKKQSKDPGSGAKGGDLDWANASSFVKEFSDAMVSLKKGEVTSAPVKSQFGFHIIRLDDIRDAQLPKIEEVKPQILQQLQSNKLAEFQQSLREKAKIE